jgi:hypothetical protein
LILRSNSTVDPSTYSQLISSWCQLSHSIWMRSAFVWNDRGRSRSWWNCEIKQSKWYFEVDEFTSDVTVLSFSIPSGWTAPDLQLIRHRIEILTRNEFFTQWIPFKVMKWTLNSNDQCSFAFHSISDNYESRSKRNSNEMADNDCQCEKVDSPWIWTMDEIMITRLCTIQFISISNSQTCALFLRSVDEKVAASDFEVEFEKFPVQSALRWVTPLSDHPFLFLKLFNLHNITKSSQFTVEQTWSMNRSWPLSSEMNTSKF